MSTSSSYNLSILSLPAYTLLTMVPHVISLHIAKNGSLRGPWDNSNPRGLHQLDALRKRLEPAQFRAYERARACHQNYFESMPVFFAAVILGNMARLPLEGWGGMNWFVGTYLALRTLHMAIYLRTDGKRKSFARGPVFVAGLGLCAWVMTRAAGKLVY